MSWATRSTERPMGERETRRNAGSRLGLAGLGLLAGLGAAVPPCLAEGTAPAAAGPASANLASQAAAPAPGAPASAATTPAAAPSVQPAGAPRSGTSTVTLLPPTSTSAPTPAVAPVLSPRQQAERARLAAERALRLAEGAAGAPSGPR